MEEVQVQDIEAAWCRHGVRVPVTRNEPVEVDGVPVVSISVNAAEVCEECAAENAS